LQLLSRLAEMRGLSVAALLRQRVREEAGRRGVARADWKAAAERLRSYYETDPDVAEWMESDEEVLEYEGEPAPTDPAPARAETARERKPKRRGRPPIPA